MLVREAQAIARAWVRAEGARMPGFWGAFYHGSSAWLPADAALPPTSDVDVMIVLADPAPPPKLGKIRYRGVLLDVAYLARDELAAPEAVLGSSHLAGSLRAPGLIADPSGELARLQAAVAADYAKRYWVRKRCEHVQAKILHNLQSRDPAAPFPDQIVPWLFATGLTTHLLLVAGLRNPTVRQRYLAARDLLAEYGHAAFYPALLDLLGCMQWTRAQAEAHLDALAEVFDVAGAVMQSPFPFAADLSAAARPIAIDGSRALIARGAHREAVFWMVATYSRCRLVLDRDAPPALRDRFAPGYARLLGDLGIATFADLDHRCAALPAFLPQVWAVAEAIMAANPAIQE
jgi:hypothetical protein